MPRKFLLIQYYLVVKCSIHILLKIQSQLLSSQKAVWLWPPVISVVVPWLSSWLRIQIGVHSILKWHALVYRLHKCLNNFLRSAFCSSISLSFKHDYSYECIWKSTASLASQDIIIYLCFVKVSKMVPVSVKWLSRGSP